MTKRTEAGERKAAAQKILLKLNNFLDVLKRAELTSVFLKEQSIKRSLNKRAINATYAIKGLHGLVEDLEEGKECCLRVLDSRTVPIKNMDEKSKLKLVKRR